MLDRRDFLLLGGTALAALATDAWAKPDCAATSRATQGPYWRADAPFSDDLRLAGGEAILVRGVIRSAKSCQPVPNALLDIWQADHHGKYDLDYGRNESFGRARVRSGKDGAYRFWTTRPAPYGGRPAHIHFIVSAPSHRSLVTQLYFAGDSRLGSDPLNDVHPDLIKTVKERSCEFDIFLG